MENKYGIIHATLSPIEKTGAWLITLSCGMGYSLIMLVRSLCWLRKSVQRRHLILRQMYLCGVESLPVTLVVAVFTGMIMATQTGIELGKYGQEDVIGTVVTLTMCREMGPFMTGLILAATVGSSMAAEIGTMKVSEEIDALEVMSIDPVDFLVMPRIAAMTVMCPVVTVFTNIVGIIGGSVVSRSRLNVSFTTYFDKAADAFHTETILFFLPKDFYTGLFKALIFGIIIATVGCSQGLRASQGAIGVGHATRQSVINSFLLIIIMGYYMTNLMY